MREGGLPLSSPSWWFDLRLFGREVRASRLKAGLSTRNLARAAGISQAYVVALEGSTSSRGPAGPCPSVQVLAGIASALRLDPAELMVRALRQAGRHVLHVFDDDDADVFGIARDLVGDVDVWISAGYREDPGASTPHIAMHPIGDVSWEPGGIEATIQAGLEELAVVLRDQRVGIVFSDLDSTLVQGREQLLSIEWDWQRIISSAAWAAGALSVTSVCLYEMDVLQRMDSAVDTALELVANHDVLWMTRARTTCTGRRASLGLLEGLRPPDVTAAQWRRACARRLQGATTARRPARVGARQPTR